MSKHNKYANFKNNIITKNNPLQPIFVPTFRQTMQQNYQQSIKHNKHYQKRSSLSFSQHSQNTSNIQLYKNNFFIKQQIRPHQTKPISFKIAELLKSSLAHSKTLANIQQKSQVQRVSINKNNKNASFSAYVNARKKIFEKKSSIYGNIQKQSSFTSLNLSPNTHKIKEKKSQFKIDQRFQVEQHEEVANKKQISIVQSQIKQIKQKYLQRLILRNKKSQLVRKQRLSPKLQDEFKAEALKNGFLKLIRKRKNQPSLLISSKKRSFSHNIKQQKQGSLQKVYARFADKKSLQEEELQFVINKQELSIQKKLLKSNIQQQLFSKAITVLQVKKGKIKDLFSLNQKTKLQIASVTKIMTCYLIIVLSQNFNLNLQKEKVIISQRASKMQGTSAKLSYSDVCTIYDLLHGLMLPSGNDAAIALGEWGGKIIRKYSSILKRQQQPLSPAKLQKSLKLISIKRKSNIKLFIHHMNKLAKHLNLNQTHYANTHGLMNEKAYSCSEDVSILSYFTMKNKTFRDIVEKKYYSCKIYNRTFSHTKDFMWKNTNKLLSIQGFIGTKTGVTPSAGPCLTSTFQLNSDHFIIVTILNTKSCEMRFRETVKLLKHTFQVLKENKVQKHLISKAIANLQLYNKDQFKDDDGQMLNDILESTSQSDKEDQQGLVRPISQQNQICFVK